MCEKIVLQETDAAVMETLSLALELEGFVVFPLAADTGDLIDYIDQVRPHIIMLDYKLDGHICIDMCHRIKEKFPHLPVIAMSCNCNIHEEYNKVGFDAYIEKPFDLDRLYHIVRKYIAKPGSASV
jgi:DNA-binding response OmpR family regulator